MHDALQLILGCAVISVSNTDHRGGKACLDTGLRRPKIVMSRPDQILFGNCLTAAGGRLLVLGCVAHHTAARGALIGRLAADITGLDSQRIEQNQREQPQAAQ